MPNHITTKITFHKDHEKAFERMASEESKFDFNNFVKMPESLNITSGGYNDYAFIYNVTEAFTKDLSAPVHHRKFYDNVLGGLQDWNYDLNRAKEHVAKLDEEGLTKLIETGKVLRNNWNLYGVGTWYEWCPKNWGTKWNAYEVSIEDNAIEFQTAWNCPGPILDLLIEELKPTCTIKSICEGGWFWFIKEYVDGVLVDNRYKLEEDHRPLQKELQYYTDEDFAEMDADE